jgi:diguanylate cyclase (GGDEF)-like protein/PAS domain S-box-containing protein
MELSNMNNMKFPAEIEETLRISAVAFETNDAIMITDADANIIRVNQSFLDTTGYSSNEVIGKNPRMMSSGKHDKSFYAGMWEQLQCTGSWSGEMFDKRKNGEIYPKWTKITAVKNELQQITHYVAVFSDLSERKRSEAEIRNLAFYDALTKLPNRHLFFDRFNAALTCAVRHNSFGAILLIDLDRFKILNDTVGHDCGDLLLIEVAARLNSCVREADTVARLGADEFVVLVEDLSDNSDEASRRIGLVAEKIRESLARPYYCNGHQLQSSPSIGVSLYHGNEESADTLVQHAEMAMYQAKSVGRNSIRFFDPVMQHRVALHAALENDLRNALSLGQLHLYYQMQVDNHHRPMGAEALLRWIHPERGLVLPGIFIPIAEESTLILEIGHWVLDTACRQLAAWGRNEQTRDLTLAVNVSARQFAIPDFVDRVAGVLQSHQVSPSRLKLELTESVMLEDMAATVKKMHALKALGVGLAMDDFGIGYSSLSYLKQLPLDQLKIDQGFVQGITMDGSDAMLVQTIIDLATNFRLSVIAEGVETEAQLTFLQHHDCMAFQGFLFGKALPLNEFERLLD